MEGEDPGCRVSGARPYRGSSLASIAMRILVVEDEPDLADALGTAR